MRISRWVLTVTGWNKLISMEQLNTAMRFLFEVGAPTNFALLQNYPNPFNPSTTIESQFQNNNIAVEIYSVIGELVASLVNQSLDAGYHKNQF